MPVPNLSDHGSTHEFHVLYLSGHGARATRSEIARHQREDVSTIRIRGVGRFPQSVLYTNADWSARSGSLLHDSTYPGIHMSSIRPEIHEDMLARHNLTMASNAGIRKANVNSSGFPGKRLPELFIRLWFLHS